MTNVKKIRIGNDIKITWSIKSKDNLDYVLEGKNIDVRMCRVLDDTPIPVDFDVVGNAVTFWFYGKDQTKLGVYGLVLVENEGREDMHTVDSCDAFQLVARSCDVDGDACGCGNIEVESVELTSTLSADVVANYPSSGVEVDSVMSDTSENPVQNKVVKKYVDDVANVATTPIYEALAIIADKAMTRDKDAVEGNVAVFDGDGNAVDSGKSVEDFKGADGEDGADGKDGADGVGVPAGGSVGQVLSKKSDEDYDTEWVDIPQGGGGGGGTADGAVLYTPQTLTDEQKSQVAKNIGQPRERLILEWSNEDAEILQPTAYDAETGYFTVETMPSWLAEDGVIVPATINYSDTILWGTGGWQNVPFAKNNTQTVQYIKRVSATTFKALSQSAEASNQMDIIASPDCTLFSYCQAKDAQKLPLQFDGEESSGIKKFKIVIKNSNLQLAKIFCGVNSSSTMLLFNNYNRVLGAYLAETRPLMVSGYMIIEVDFDNAQYRYLEYQLSGLNRTGAQTVTPYVQMSKNTEQWSSVWPNTKPISQAFFLLLANALTKKCNVKIYEIYE